MRDMVRGGLKAFRTIRNKPGFAAMLILTVTLAIGANATVFSIVHSLLLRTLPVSNPEQLCLLSYRLAPPDDSTQNGYLYRMYRAIQAENPAFEDILARSEVSARFEARDFTGKLFGEIVSGNYFKVLGVRALIGRTLSKDDDSLEGDPFPIVISYRLWQTHFGADSNILNHRIQINRHSFYVVGVTNSEFAGSAVGQYFDFQVPICSGSVFRLPLTGSPFLGLLGRRKVGISLAQAESISSTFEKQVAVSFAREIGPAPRKYLVEDGSRGFSELRSRLQRPALILMLAAILLLLIACSNFAGLLSARAIANQRETAVCIALGASRSQLIRIFLAEGMVFALIGGACGLVIAKLASMTCVRLLEDGAQIHALQVSLDPVVVTISLAVSLLAAVLFGFLPAVQASRATLNSTTGQGTAAVSHGHGISFIRRGLVVVQVALSIILLCCAGVLSRTLNNLLSMDLGFDVKQVAVLMFDPLADGYSPAATRDLLPRILERTRLLPTTEQASFSSMAVLTEDTIMTFVDLGSQTVTSEVNFVSPGYFDSLHTPILEGQDFDGRTTGEPYPIIVNERFASLCWPGQMAVGRQIKVMGKRALVLGVVKNAHYRKVREQPPPTVYFRLLQASPDSIPLSQVTLIVRGRASAERTVTLVSRAIRSVAPNLTIQTARSLADQRNDRISTERTLAFVSSLFGAVAGTLALIGMYGVIALDVFTRRKEIGVRMALGGTTSHIVAIFTKETLLIMLAGAVVGAPLAWMSLHMLNSFVFGLPSQDPATMLVTLAILFVLAFLAVIPPVLSATYTDPARTIRDL